MSEWIPIIIANCILLIIIFYLIRYVFKNVKKAKEAYRYELCREQLEKEAEAKRKKEEYEAYQQSIRQRILAFVPKFATILENLNEDIKGAEHSLAVAEGEYSDRAFSPFWDAVEHAVTCLARFDSGIQKFFLNFNQYKSEMEKLNSSPPFQVDINALPKADRTVDRMRSIVRSAQKDFHFSTIYEQRKTNQLLVKGFTSLGETLSEIGYRIECSTEALSSAICDLSVSSQEKAKELIVEVESFREQMQSDAAARRDHEQKEIKILDNIQRGKKPLF